MLSHSSRDLNHILTDAGGDSHAAALPASVNVGTVSPTPPQLKGGEKRKTVSEGDNFATQTVSLTNICSQGDSSSDGDTFSPYGCDYFAATGYLYSGFDEIQAPDGKSYQVPLPDLDRTLKHLRHLVYEFWDDFTEDEYSIPARGYALSYSWYKGCIKISWHPERPDQRVHFLVTGSLLELLDVSEQMRLIHNLVAIHNFRPSRVDLYVRDFDFAVDPKDLKSWADQGFMCRFQHDNFDYREKGPYGNKGRTFYAGTRGKSGGEMFWRCYDESLEPRSPVPAIKFECEYRGVKADNLIRRFFKDFYRSDSDPESWGSFFYESTVGPGVIDFRSGSHTEKLSNRQRLPDWDAFVSRIQFVRIQGKVKKPQRSGFPLAAFTFQWGKKLAEVFLKYVGCTGIATSLLPSQLAQILYAAITDGVRRLRRSKGKNLNKSSVSTVFD